MNEVTNEINKSETTSTPPQERPKWIKEALDWAKSIIFALVLVLIINQFVFHLSKVDGQSMEPTLQHGERLFVNKMVYLFDSPKSGDVVILKNPSEYDKRYLVKRVVAEPGDKVEIRMNMLYVNGKKVEESYLGDQETEGDDYGPITLGRKEYFVMGDNRHLNRSHDSRAFGPVKEELIEGRADFILWPVTQWGKL